MYFHPQTLLFLKYGDRSVAVFRDQCHTVEVSCQLFAHQSITLITLVRQRLLVVARGIFPPLQGVSASDVILSASIPGYPDPDLVELAPEIWTTVFPVLHGVTITHEPGASQSDEWFSDDRQRNLVFPRNSKFQHHGCVLLDGFT